MVSQKCQTGAQFGENGDLMKTMFDITAESFVSDRRTTYSNLGGAMCISCWENLGSPAVLNPAVMITALAIQDVHRYHSWALHIAIDHWDLDDESLVFCDGAIERTDREGVTEEQRKAERLCVSLLEHLSMDERASALALHDGFITTVPEVQMYQVEGEVVAGESVTTTSAAEQVRDVILTDPVIISRRAEFVYNAARLAAIASGAPIVPVEWCKREQPFQDQFLKVIERQMGDQRSSSPEELHGSWMQSYLNMGWVYGPEYDREAKIHPDLVPYANLGQLERDKDAVFVALCEIARQWIGV